MIEEPTTTRPTPAWTAGALALIVAAYAIVFGPATYYAVQILLDPTTESTWQTGTEVDVLRNSLLQHGLAIAVTVLVIAIALRGLRMSPSELGLRRVSPGFPLGMLGAVAAAYLAIRAGGFLEGLANIALPAWNDALAGAEPGTSEISSGTPLWLANDAVRGVGASVSEELLLLALPIAVAVRLGWSTPVIFAVLVVLRVPFHLWHGPAAVVLGLVWMAVALWVYRRVGSVWPFVVAHVLSYLLVGPYPQPVAIAGTVASLALTVLGLVLVIRRYRAERAPSTVPAA